MSGLIWCPKKYANQTFESVYAGNVLYVISETDMDADDIMEMVGMSLSSKEEMARIKETIWKQNEIIRILLRQQNEKGIFQKTPGTVWNHMA